MENKERTCCFTGHRKLPQKDMSKIRAHLYEAIEMLIQRGVIYYGAGGAMGFDTLAAQVVLELREKYPAVKLILVLPCKDQTRGWPTEDVTIYEEIQAVADKVVYTSEAYSKGCMHKRNRHLVDNSGHCICYLTELHGGTAYTAEYAKKQGLNVWNVATSRYA